MDVFSGSGLGYALLGGVLVTLLGPVLEPTAARLNKYIWKELGHFQQPDVDVQVEYSSPYEMGDTIGEFDDFGVDWARSFQIVDLKINHVGERPIQDLKCDFELEGLLLAERVVPTSYPDAHTTMASFDEVHFEVESGVVYETVKYGRMSITSNYLPVDQVIHYQFLVDTDTSWADFFVELEESESVSYRWDFHGISYLEERDSLSGEDC